MLSYRKKDDGYLVKDKVDNVVEVVTEEELINLQRVMSIQRGKPSLEEYIAKCKLLGKNPEYIDSKSVVLKLLLPENKQLHEIPFDTSKIISFAGIFKDSKCLDVFDASMLDFHSGVVFNNFMEGSTVREVDFTGMYASPLMFRSAFEDCCLLEKFNQGDTVDFSKLKKLDCMFKGCTELTKVKMNLSKAISLTDINSMFRDCTNLTEVDFDKDLQINESTLLLDTSRLFYGCVSLKKVNLGHMNLSAVKYWEMMFALCPSLEIVDMHNIVNFGEGIYNKLSTMFYSSPLLRKIYVNSREIKSAIERFIPEHTEVIIVELNNKFV